MAEELAFDDLIYGVGDDDSDVFELSYATFAEELQLQEILEGSMIASERTTSEQSPMSSSFSSSPLPSPILSTPEAISSPGSEPSLEELETDFTFKTEKELEEAVCEAIKKSGCPVCHRLSCTKCTIPQGSGLNCDEQQSIDQSSALGCNEQRQRTDRDEKRRERFRPRELRGTRSTRHYQSKFNGRWKGDIPETSSSNKFRAKTSSRAEDVHIAGIGNTQDPKGKGIAIDDDWLLVSKKKLDNRFGNSATNRWGSKDNNSNDVLGDDYDSLDDEDDLDSDTSQKSCESRKKSKWFKEFFEGIDALSIEEIDETPWHCPACQGGPGAIKWYRSIQDLIAHAKKIGTRRAKLHRELAELLEGELHNKGTSMAPTDQIIGNWKGLKQDSSDHEIVWPPMVVIVNTMSSIYKDGKCVGMGSQELLEQFSSYPAFKAQHSYGPQGHRGLSVLIFESSAVGYLEAERLHKDFVDQGLDRFARNSCPNVVLPGGDRQLYGFMAVKEDLDNFNQHCQGKSKIKYQLKSYREMVLNEIVKMSEDSQQLIWLKGRLEAETRRANTLEASANNLSRNLQQKMEDIRLFKQRVQLLHQQNEEEMDSQENFYKDQIKILEARVEQLEKLQESDANPEHAGEPSPAMADLVDEQTPYQYNSNLSVDARIDERFTSLNAFANLRSHFNT